MRRILIAIAALPLLSGCFSSTPQPPILYDLVLPPPISAAGKPLPLPIRAAVEAVAAEPPLERSNLLWRDAEREVELVFDPNRRWKAPPPVMVRGAFLDRARDHGWFQWVGPAGDPGPFTYGLRMRLRVFENVIRKVEPPGGGKPEEVWFGRLVVEFHLYPLEKDDKPVVFVQFRDERKADRRDPEAVARALSDLLATAFDQFRQKAFDKLQAKAAQRAAP